MLIDVDRIPEEGLNISKDFEFFTEDLVEESAVFLKPVHVDAAIKKIGEELLIKGQITTTLNFVCCRCLTPFEFPVDSGFDLIYLPEELEVAKEHLEQDDMNRLFYYKRNLDLKEVILEQLNLTFPLRPLCSQGCQGICPVCGKLIQEDKCSCTAKGSDRRLEKFKIFLRDKS
jgi:uncharacterized protein